MNKELFDRITKLDLENLPDDPVVLKEIIFDFANAFSELYSEVVKLKEENQQLKNEINRLKGEQGKPEFKKVKEKTEYRKTIGHLFKRKPKSKPHKKSSKKEKDIPIHKEVTIEAGEKTCEICGSRMNRNGSKDSIVQDVLLILYNTKYILENMICSNKECNHTISATLPEPIKREFGESVRSLLPFLYYGYGLSQYQLYHLLSDLGMIISEGTINNFIQEAGNKCIPIAEQIFKYNIKNHYILNMDETKWKTDTTNKILYNISNAYMSYFTIKPKRNSKTVNEILACSDFVEDEYGNALAMVFLITDDHSSYSLRKIHVLGSQLCWVHEIRHYKKLLPYFYYQDKEGEKVYSELWELYDKIQEYRDRNTETGYNKEEADIIEKRFDEIFTQPIRWETLKHQLGLTIKKKERLLYCLQYPEVEHHNNRAEQDLRHWAGLRHKNQYTKTEQGEHNLTAAKSTIGTLKKLKRNVFKEFTKIVEGTYEIDIFLPDTS